MSNTAQEIQISLKRWVPIFSLTLIPFWVGSYGGKLSYILDLISNFKLQILYGALAVFLINLILKNWKTVLWSVFAVVSLGYEVIVWSLPYTGDAYGIRELKIYYSNVLTSNKRSDILIAQVREEEPDIIALLEVNQRWNRELKSLRASFPFEKVITREDNFGLALFSKYELSDIGVLYFSQSRVPSISCTVNILEGRSIRLLVTHPMPPISTEGFTSRNEALEKIGHFLSKQPSSTIMVGDLNITMWSPYYQKMTEMAPRVYNARQGFGVAPTWPSSNFTRIPIDHCFLSRDLKARDFRVLESNGSDHLPIVIEVLY